MIKSMTAYSRYSFHLGKKKLTFEVHSLNKKGLDVSVFLPKEMFFLDIEIRKWVTQVISRGQITVRLNRECLSETVEASLPDKKNIYAVKQYLTDMSVNLGYSSGDVSFEFVIEQCEKLSKFDDIDAVKHVDEIKEAFNQALRSLMNMKAVEGDALKNDLLTRIKIIIKQKELINTLRVNEPADYQAKLEQKIAKFGPICEDNKEKIAREVVLFADKIDFSEELARLDSHLHQFLQHMDTQQHSIGKTLEFLILEMNRETNTILSKTSLLEIGNAALAIKSELEKMREQVQNIE